MDINFKVLEKKTGVIANLSNDTFPTKVLSWGVDNKPLNVDGKNDTSFGYVFSGKATLRYNNLEFPLNAGMYFSVPENFEISGGSGIIITALNKKALFHIGGPVEEKGRLKYIDGCSDTLLIAPWLKGEACLNHLHFPSNITQTIHTHPSNRIGIVTKGNGICKANGKTYTLSPGTIWIIPTNCEHGFFTKEQEMDVVSFHPDSDFGPEHENHPMINRTIVEGKSARDMKEIQTKD